MCVCAFFAPLWVHCHLWGQADSLQPDAGKQGAAGLLRGLPGDGEDEADLMDLSDKELMAALDDDLRHKETG